MENLPIELVFSEILPHVKWNDLLRLRQVSNTMKNLVDEYIVHELKGIPNRIEIEINETSQSWADISTFLQMGFQVSVFYLNNPSGHAFFSSDQITEFVQIYGSQIRQLRVHKFSTYLSRKERSFYESLENLICLQVETVVGKKGLCKQALLNTTDRPFHQQLPSSFENLRFLHINNNVSNQNVSEQDMLMFNVSILDKCLKLEELSLGTKTQNMSSYFNSISQCFYEISNHVDYRARKFPRLPNLKIFDLQSFGCTPSFISQIVSSKFLALCMKFVRYRIKMRNVPAVFFKAFRLRTLPDTIFSVVESLDGIHPSILGKEMPNMLNLSIWTFDQKSFLESDANFHVATWPVLQEINLYIDRTTLPSCNRQGQEIPSISVDILYSLLFETRRTSVAFLKLVFSKRMGDTLFQPMTVVPCPRVTSIVSSCPNITTLKIVNWPEKDDLSFSAFWKGLELLEEVYLERCKMLGDRAFIGDKLHEPAFLQLKNLKKLSLVGLDKMPGITDMTFILVLRHMKLKELILNSGKPIKNVTKDGILSLTTGDVLKSVERFSFNNWSLASVCVDEEWEALRSHFPQ